MLLLLRRLYRLGQGLAAQIIVQVVILTIVQRLVKQPFTELCLQVLTSIPSCRIVVKETADSGIGSQQVFRFRKIGNGVQYDIVLRVQSGVLRIVLHSDGKKRQIVHEALEQITHSTWFSTLSDMGDVFRGSASLEITVAHLISSCHIREADGKVSLVTMREMQFLTFSFGEFGIYPPFLQVRQQCW